MALSAFLGYTGAMQEYPSLVWHLKNTQLFEDLAESEIEQLSRITPYKRFSAGEIIYHMEDPADALYFVREGMVKISMYFPNGKEMILGLLGQYDIFGELLLLESERRPNQAEAVVDTTLIVMPEGDFQRLLQQQPRIAMKFIKVMSTRLWQAQQWQAEVGAFDAPGRLANLLVRLANDFGVEGERGTVIDLNLTQQDLAKMIGATRETVSHCLARLLEYGAVKRRRAPITVNLQRLQQFLDEASE
jgi:CRP/FNR family transcriptional regulator, cyclic AMP receptor protein